MLSRLILACLFVISVPAKAFEKPKACTDFYDPIYILNADLNDADYVYKEPYFYEHNIEKFSITVGDLKKYKFAAEDAHLIATERILNLRWLTQGVKKLLVSATSYSGLLNGEYQSKVKNEAMACVDKKAPSLKAYLTSYEQEQQELNEDKLELFILDSLSSAYLAETLLNYLNEKEENKREQLEAMSDCLRDAHSWAPFHEKRIKECEDNHSDQDHTVSTFMNETKNQSEVLSRLFQNKHLLFELRNNFKLLNWFNSKVYMSPFAEALASQIPGSYKRSLKEAISGEKKPHQIMIAFNRVRREFGQQFLEIGEKIKNDAGIRRTFRTEYFQYLAGIYDSVKFHCENNGQFLHFHSQLLDSMAAQMKKGVHTLKSPAENKKVFIAYQGHQCRRWRQQPYEDSNQWTTKKVMGMGLLCFGMVSAIVPGIGWVATTAMIGSGTGLLMAQNLEDQKVAADNLRSHQFAWLNSWQDFRGIIQEDDRISDIKAEYVIEGVFAVAGAATQMFRLPERVFRASKHVENMQARGAGSAVDRANNMDDLINTRYLEAPADTEKANWAVTRLIRWINRNNEIPAHLRKVQKDGSDYFTMIKTIASKDGSIKLRDEAFDDLYKILQQYEDHRNTIRRLIQQGENSRTYLAQLDEYMKQLKPNHFRRNNPAPLPDFPNSTMKLERGEGGSILMHFEGIAHQGDHFVDGQMGIYKFHDWDELMAQRAQWKDTYSKTFTQNAFEEYSGISKISEEIHAQALRFMILRTARRNMSLASDGVRTTENGATHSLGLTDRQSLSIEFIDDYLAREDLFPRADAFDNLMGDSARAEYWDLAFGALRRRLGQSKYANEISNGAVLLAKSLALRIALLGGTAAALSNIGLEGWVEQNRTLYYAFHGFKEGVRESWRWFNKLKDRSGIPYGYTGAEKICAQESRDWTVENVCLYAELRKELWREAFEIRFNPDYDIAKDAELDRKMRRYIRRYVANREHFGDGALFNKFTDILPDVGNDYVRAKSEEFIVENMSSLKDSGFAIASLLSQILQEPDKIERLDQVKERLESMDSPQSVLIAFDELSQIMETGFPGAIQNPGTSPQIEAFIKYLVDRARQQAEAESKTSN